VAKIMGFDALIKRWDSCINLGERLRREINVLFPVRILNILSFIFIHNLSTDSLSYIHIYVCVCVRDTC
jgi:hypothetical protein